MASPRLSLGAALLGLRQKYRHGVRTAYYRDTVRPRILATPPVPCGPESGAESGKSHPCEIHVLTSAADCLNLIWALKSFFKYSGRAYGLCIHDDGSLPPHDAETLLHHFPGARLIVKTAANREIETALQPFPRCLKFRRSNHLSPKLFDFAHYLTSPRMLLIDSDILFFSKPDELLRRCEDPAYHLNSVNSDVGSAYTVTESDAKNLCGVTLLPRFNSGLGVIHRDSLRFDWIEEFLALPGIEGHFWRIEQTIYALCSSRFGAELLPAPYTVHLEGGIQDAPCRHYVGAIRHLMYGEGMRLLAKRGFLGRP